MRQHYLPQFYLKGFLEPNIPAGHEPYLWVFSREPAQWRKRAPRNVASRPDLYTVHGTDGNKRVEFEQGLSILEGKTATLYRQTIARCKPLEDTERAVVAEFLARMLVCVPSFLESVDAFLCENASQQMATFATDPEAFREFKDIHLKPAAREPSGGLRQEDTDPKHWGISASRAYSLRLILEVLPCITKILASMSWTFLISTGGAHFITGDSPFCMVDPENTRAIIGHGLANEDIEVSFPLSSRFAVLASWKAGPAPYVPVRPRTVAKLNRRVVCFARDLVLACKPNFPGDDALALLGGAYRATEQ